MTFLRLLPLPLRPRRLGQFVAVLRAGRKPSWLDYWRMARLALTAPPVDRRWAQAAYWRCWHCPVFDRELRRCGDGDGFGCGCSAPLAIAFRKPCWIRTEDPDSPHGYLT